MYSIPNKKRKQSRGKLFLISKVTNLLFNKSKFLCLTSFTCSCRLLNSRGHRCSLPRESGVNVLRGFRNLWRPNRFILSPLHRPALSHQEDRLGRSLRPMKISKVNEVVAFLRLACGGFSRFLFPLARCLLPYMALLQLPLMLSALWEGGGGHFSFSFSV